MKLLLTMFMAFIASASFTQICTIDYTQTQVGIYPDTLPVGYVGQPYSADVTFKMPTDTMGYNFTNFKILSVSLPVGLNWQCNNSSNNCNYNPQVNQYGCVHIGGTPLLPGQYNVDVTVIADLTVLQGYPFTFQIYLEILPNNTSTTNDGFSMVGASGCSPITVSFANNNPGLLAYEWNFGNGNTSTVENPVPQVYTTPGDYIVQYKAFDNLNVVNVYTLTNLSILSMSNYGGGFPSFETADPYFKLKENGTVIYQSTIIQDQNPPVSWPVSIVLNPANTYVFEIWEADETVGEVLFGADDYMGNHTLSLNGCSGCTAGTSSISYTVTNQVINPTPLVVSQDTIHVYGYPSTPNIAFDSPTSTVSTIDQGYNYQWYFNGSPIANATNTSYVVNQSGIYHVIAINNNGCVSFSDTITGVYCDPAIAPGIAMGGNNLLIATNVPNSYNIQWLFNNFPINGQTNDTIAALLQGQYSVEITDAFGCVHSSSMYTVSASLDEMQANHWSVYPNPSNGDINVTLSNQLTASNITLVDLYGHELKTWEIDGQSKIQLDLKDQNAGIYFLRISGQGIQSTKRIIIR